MICTDFWCGIDDMHPVAQRIYSLRYNPDSIWHSSQILWRRKKHIWHSSQILWRRKTHLFAFQATGCRLPSWGPGYTKADKKENKLQEQTLSRALIILKLFYIFQSEETSSKTWKRENWVWSVYSCFMTGPAGPKATLADLSKRKDTW